MIRLGADEDFNGIILRGLRRRLPGLDLVRAHTVGLGGALDEVVLEWAPRDERLLLSHDANTMIAEAYARIDRGEAMWGLLIVPKWLGIGSAIEETSLVVECSEQDEWRNRVDHLPLK